MKCDLMNYELFLNFASMKKLLSLPPNLVERFHDITSLPEEEWFCTNDPIGQKLGSGGGTTWLLTQAYHAEQLSSQPASDAAQEAFDAWLQKEKRILLHAGGQSRRLPAYAPSGKVLTPIPVFRWERGQQVTQNLLSLQMPLYEQIMEAAPKRLNTLIVSGDVYIRATKPIGHIPDVDVVCYGLWLDAEIAQNHGVFISSREEPARLQCMLQKPSKQKLSQILEHGYYLTDIGIWLLSDKAVRILMKKSAANPQCHDTIATVPGAYASATQVPNSSDGLKNYDLYSDFGCALGYDPTNPDPDISSLSVAILPLEGGEFYHYGTTPEIISSTLAIQNVINDQREIMHYSRKPHPAIFIQNSALEIKVSDKNRNLWIENSYINSKWELSENNVITGVPQNDWHIRLMPGQCIDVIPYKDDLYIVRPYGYKDKFRGPIDDLSTTFLGTPFPQWAAAHGILPNSLEKGCDIQAAHIFPVFKDLTEAGIVLQWMLSPNPSLAGRDSIATSIPYETTGLTLWKKAEKLSADDISSYANLQRLTQQRTELLVKSLPLLAENYRHSIFFQSDLHHIAGYYSKYNIPLPAPIVSSSPRASEGILLHDSMFRSEVKKQMGLEWQEDGADAFSRLRKGLTQHLLTDKQMPRLSVCNDQIVWGRSPVRIDIAGGWTDTPPYCLMEGGKVINLAIELGGQPPLHAYIKPGKTHDIILRSIDLGAMERITTYEELCQYNKVGSPFSIPKAALALAGFHPDFCMYRYDSLEQQLQDFGCGIEVTMLSAIPAGSGLGTSSILAATVLGALNDFCGLAWDKNEIGLRTLILEQLLTTGGGWQDQFGGVLGGIKLLQTEKGYRQTPHVRWLPDDLYTMPEYAPCHLLYYTGITRTAKTLLAEIVRRMFLNHNAEMTLLRQMKEHTMQLYETIQRGDFCGLGQAIRRTWNQNQTIDAGTNPPAVKALTDLVDDLCLGYKLPGAGGGGFLYMVAKDNEAAGRIKEILTAHAITPNARFVDMTLSKRGLQVSMT